MGWWSFLVWSLWVSSQVLCGSSFPSGEDPSVIGGRHDCSWTCCSSQPGLDVRTGSDSLGVGGLGLVSGRVPSCLCGCCQSPCALCCKAARWGLGLDGCSRFLNRAKWHQVLEGGRQLVQLTPRCLGFCCVVTKMRTVQVVIHTRNCSAWKSACDTCFWWSAACW